MPVAVPRRKIHLGEIGSITQRFVHEAHVFEELHPVERRYETHAGDDVADREVHRGLGLMLGPHDLVRSGVLLRKPLVEPPQGGRHCRILVAHPLHELDGESPRQRVPGEVGEQIFPRLRADLESEETIRECIGFLAGLPPGDDAFGQAPKVLDEDDAKRDRDRPQLPDRQRLNALVGANEAEQRLRVELAVRVCHERPRQPEDARIVFQMTRRELGKIAVVAWRQVLPDFTQLFFYDVKVVDEPFRSRCDRALIAYRLCDRAV